MEIKYTYPTEQDILELASNLSEADRVELVCQGFAPEEAIRLSIEHSSECVAIFAPTGELACITGICADTGLGCDHMPWLLATDIMVKYPKQIMRISRILLDKWKTEYPYMVNFVDARHTRAIRWLSYLGAAKELIPSHGYLGRPFYKFTFGEPY